ncbi:conserved membrane hypothetical protein [Gammaproteobacteria bacterium]
MPSRLMKKTSLIAALTLGTAVAGNVAWAASPPTETIATQDAPLFTPMSDAAAMGVGCLVAGSSSLAAAYALGPTELMMLVTGAVIVPSTSSLLFVALGGILGAGACGVGAALTPTVLWTAENAEGIKTTIKPKPRVISTQAVPQKVAKVDDVKVRPMNEGEIQGTGCLLGILGLGAITLAAAPTEIVMLAAGGVTVPSKTSLLMMGILGTVVPASCTIGSAASLPLVALYQNFDGNAIGQKLASMVGWGRSSPAPIALQTDAEQPKSGNQESSPLLVIAAPKLAMSTQVGRQEPEGNVLPLPPTYNP